MTRMTRRVAALCLGGLLMAVLLGFGVSGAVPAAAQQATPTPTPVTTGNIPVLGISPALCLLLVGARKDLTSQLDPLQCENLDSSTGTPNPVQKIADIVGNKDGVVQPSDFAGIDLDGNQIHQLDPVNFPPEGSLFVMAWVPGHAEVTFHTNRGIFVRNGASLGQNWTCTAAEDDDCDPTATAGDGVVVVNLRAQLDGTNPAPVGPGTVTINQVPPDQATMAFRVVGEPRALSFITLKNTIQDGIPVDAAGAFVDPTQCPLPGDAAGFLGANGTAEKAIVLAVAKDIDGNAVTGAIINWSTSDPQKGHMATALTPTLDLGSFGFGAPNILCGTNNPGTLTVNADISRAVVLGAVNINPFDAAAVPAKAKTDFTVKGVPASMTLAAAPASLPCDGTASSTVTATIVDAAGNPVAAGQPVNFNVQVLGTSNPINAKTDDKGVTTSVITPLSAGQAGVPVVVTAGDVSSSILISCVAGAATTPAPGAGTPAPGGGPATGITGPNTGTGDATAAAGMDWMIAALSALGLLAGSAMVWQGARARRR